MRPIVEQTGAKVRQHRLALPVRNLYRASRLMNTLLMKPPTIPAPLWLRLAAAVYDLLPLIAIWFFTAIVGFAISAGTMDAPHPPLWYRLLLLTTTAAYFVTSWVRGGQTIGMKPWRLRVQRRDGGHVTVGQAIGRFVLALISLLLFGAGFLWTLIDAERRSWHDLAMGTVMVRTPTDST